MLPAATQDAAAVRHSPLTGQPHTDNSLPAARCSACATAPAARCLLSSARAGASAPSCSGSAACARSAPWRRCRRTQTSSTNTAPGRCAAAAAGTGPAQGGSACAVCAQQVSQACCSAHMCLQTALYCAAGGRPLLHPDGFLRGRHAGAVRAQGGRGCAEADMLTPGFCAPGPAPCNSACF